MQSLLVARAIRCFAASLLFAAPALATQTATNLTLVHQSGQTFLTWTESSLVEESYKIYRSTAPITTTSLPSAQFLREVGENSGEFYADRAQASCPCGQSAPGIARYLQRIWVPITNTSCGVMSSSIAPVNTNTGVFVWTPDTAGVTYYAVTTVTAAGVEDTTIVAGQNTASISESVCDPMPIDVTLAVQANPPYSIPDGLCLSPIPPGVHVYIQFMDLAHWNGTFHAPNATNCWWGEDPSRNSIKKTLQYAYTYTVAGPPPGSPTCPGTGGQPPLAVVLSLHPHAGNRLAQSWSPPVGSACCPTATSPGCKRNPYGDGCTVKISPVDVSDTWWFGFADDNYDYRLGTPVNCANYSPSCTYPCFSCSPLGECSDLVPDPSVSAPSVGHVVNYTELRVLRMIHDLQFDPAFGALIDMNRVYVQGHSMGGSGALSLAMRYPNVFAAAAGSKPMTDYHAYAMPVYNNAYRNELLIRWGKIPTNMRVEIRGPSNWADHLQNVGTRVWDWQDHPKQMALRIGEDMAPFGITNGVLDTTIPYATQAQTVYPVFVRVKRCWGGLLDCTDHSSQIPAGLPPGLTTAGSALFQGYQVRRDETVPGFSGGPNAVPNPSSCTPATYYHDILWSSSWNPWDVNNGNVASPGAPINTTNHWNMSLQTAPGVSGTVTLNVTPRRLGTNGLIVAAGLTYSWQSYDVSTGAPVVGQSGTGLTIGTDGLLTIMGVDITASGRRLDITQP